MQSRGTAALKAVRLQGRLLVNRLAALRVQHHGPLLPSEALTMACPVSMRS